MTIDLTAFTALGARIDAVAAALPGDISSGDSSAISAGVSSSLSAINVGISTSLASTATSLGVQVSSLEVAAGVSSSLPSSSLSSSLSGISSSLSGTSLSGVSSSLSGTSNAITISPTTITTPVGTPLNGQLDASGGAGGPYSFAIDPARRLRLPMSRCHRQAPSASGALWRRRGRSTWSRPTPMAISRRAFNSASSSASGDGRG
jgi:hypothetical protein